MKQFLLVMLALVYLVLITATNLPAQCTDYSCDYQNVRAILDNNGMFDVPVAKVAQSADGRITGLNLVGSGEGRNLPYRMNLLPEKIGNLTALKKLDLSGNRIRKIPEGISQLTHLTELYLYDNKLDKLPQTLTTLPGLIYFDVSKNRLWLVTTETKRWIRVTTIVGDWSWRHAFTVDAAAEARKIAVRVTPPQGIPALNQARLIWIYGKI
jgi:Leucine-rich repeat (LRR) protein